jgi:hypothetical protein
LVIVVIEYFSRDPLDCIIHSVFAYLRHQEK